MKNKLIIMRGPSGSGKSTLAKQLKQKYYEEGYNAGILSTDNFFIEDFPHHTESSKYIFDPSMLKKYHARTFADFCTIAATYHELEFNKDNEHYICAILDNTNIKWWEFELYVRVAKKLEFDVEQAIPEGEWSALELFGRNKHGVPLDTIRRMIESFDPKEEIEEKIKNVK